LVKLVSGTFPGKIDEFRVWDRVLSEAEVQASYSAGRNAQLQVVLPADSTGASRWSVIGANAVDQVLQSDSMTINVD
jgi:hypothetical protein